MGKLVLTDAYLSVGGNDISANVRQIAVEYSADSVEDTTMGDTTHTFLGGLKNYSISATLANDFASGALDSILFPMVGTHQTVAIRPSNAAVGAGNPEYGATMLVQSYPIFGNGVGDLAEATLELLPGGASADLTRSTS